MKRSVLLMLIIAVSIGIKAQEDVNKYKAMFTLSFVRYVGWPDEVKTGDFVIGVVADNNIAALLKEQSNGKKFGYQNIVIKEFNTPEEVQNCQILYVSEKGKFFKNADLYKQKLGGKNSLVITETDGAINKGSMINFVVEEGKLKFEVSTANAGLYGIRFSNTLLTLNNAIIK